METVFGFALFCFVLDLLLSEIKPAVKRIVHIKIQLSSIINSPSCHSQPIRLSFMNTKEDILKWTDNCFAYRMKVGEIQNNLTVSFLGELSF